jgi:uncharacterized protein
MSIELLPVGNKCSLSCSYCYEEGMREKGNFSPKYDSDAMAAQLEKVDANFLLFGGEPLLTPIPDLHRFWEIGLRRFGQNGIQTSLSYIKEEHFEMFKKYNVYVGVSLDGPEKLNSPRCDENKTAQIHTHFTRLLRDGYSTALILTLHRANATAERFPTLLNWFMMLGNLGLQYARLHLLEVDTCAANDLTITDDEAFHAIMTLHDKVPKVKFDLYSEMEGLLAGTNPNASCIWNGCDPYTTPAVQGIQSDGTASNCGRANKEGIDWQKAAKHGNERLIALYNTPEEFNGCSGCRFFFACKGECPGQSADWRERTSYCGLLKRLFAEAENRIMARGAAPLSSRKYEFNEVLVSNQQHGDHYDYARIQVPVL